MTGTLMQNELVELFALINLVRPGLLGNQKEFKDYYAKPIQYARSKESNEAVMEIGTEREHELRGALKSAFLERKKEDVLKGKMTEKNEKVIMCPMTDIQKRLYRHLFSLSDFATLRFANCPCDCGVNQQYFKGDLLNTFFLDGSLLTLILNAVHVRVSEHENEEGTSIIPAPSSKGTDTNEAMLLPDTFQSCASRRRGARNRSRRCFVEICARSRARSQQR